MKKSDKVFIQWMKDGNAYREFLLNHNLTEKDMSLKEFMMETNESEYRFN